MLSDRTDYLNAFELIFKDYLEITQYIEPSNHNFKTFSHRVYALYLRACTEFESVCKEVLQLKHRLPTGNPNITHYIQAEPDLGLEDRDVGFHFWHPKKLYIEPFKLWTTSKPPLPWYKSYNNVKHNRASHFAEANFENLTYAVAGVFLIMAQANIFPTEQEWQHTVRLDNDFSDAFFPRWGLSIRDRKQ
ncbi:MAG: hypothetical protein KME64_34360 [Scytonematopsis contorta HA4267-MV1]|jgi:hypothetical protein|nr:hypothetical protein [Scytonematopsis contorta HA4267-MV1]